jgi:hypothetical protein
MTESQRRKREAFEQAAQDFANKIRDQVSAFTPSQESKDAVANFKDAIARYLPPRRPLKPPTRPLKPIPSKPLTRPLKSMATRPLKPSPTRPPLRASKPMSGKTWLEGNKTLGIPSGFKRFPQQSGESLTAWAKRLSAAASGEDVQIKPNSIETHLHQRKRQARKS